MTNRRLWEEWTDALELAASDPDNEFAKRREGKCMDEIVRRMKEASAEPKIRQEA